MASPRSDDRLGTVTLPADWTNLDLEARFNTFFGSPHSVRGRGDEGATVNCERESVISSGSGYQLGFSSPGRESGSYAFRYRDEQVLRGRLDVVRSFAQGDRRLMILSQPGFIQRLEFVPHPLSRREMTAVATLFQAYFDRCFASPGHPIQVYLIVKKRDA